MLFVSLYIIFYIYYIITFTFIFIIWISRTVEDFRDWTNWLFYRGGIGVKGEESWEAWWDEELVHFYKTTPPFLSLSPYNLSLFFNIKM